MTSWLEQCKQDDRLFEEAEIARFSPRELREYEDSRKAYRDLKNSLDHAEEKGYVKGKRPILPIVF